MTLVCPAEGFVEEKIMLDVSLTDENIVGCSLEALLEAETFEESEAILDATLGDTVMTFACTFDAVVDAD